MEMTYNVNPEQSPVNSKLCDYSVEKVVLFDGKTGTGSAQSIDVSGKTFAYIDVFGTFDASIRVLGYYTDRSGDSEYVELMERRSNAPIKSIRAAGGYFIDLTKYTWITVTVLNYTSGDINVQAQFYTKPIGDLFSAERNAQLAYSHAVPVDGGAYALAIEDVKISKYPFQYVAVRADSSHNFRVSLYYRHTNNGSLGSVNGDLFALDLENTVRGVSEWIEARGNIVDVYIYNDSGEAHTYDVYLYGVG
jgi:hypothetical protein